MTSGILVFVLLKTISIDFFTNINNILFEKLTTATCILKIFWI